MKDIMVLGKWHSVVSFISREMKPALYREMSVWSSHIDYYLSAIKN